MWGKKFDKCQGCGTTDRPPHGRGLCERCYWNQRYQNDPEVKARILAKKKARYQAGLIKRVDRKALHEAKRKAEYENRFPLPGQWAIEKEPDLFGRRIIGQVVNTRRDQEHYGEKMVVLELALTGHKVPLKLETLERYRGEVPQRMGAWELPEVDLNELLGVAW